MALPLDPTGQAPGNHITAEVHNVNLLKDKHFVPLHGAFFVHGLKVRNTATGQLLKPLLQFNVLQQNIIASNTLKQEIAQIIHIVDNSITNVSIDYHAVGGEYESVGSKLTKELDLFRSKAISSVITGVNADELITLPPRELLSTPRPSDTGSTIYTQLSNIAEAIEAGDPSGQQLAYEYMLNYKTDSEQTLKSKISSLSKQLVEIDNATRVTDGQYIFTREELNPYIYLNYGNWVKDSNSLFYSTVPTNPEFGKMESVQQGYGLLGLHVMAYRRDDSAPVNVYTIRPDRNTMNEGESVIFTLTAADIPAGTSIPYLITGVDPSDIVGGSLSGSFIMGREGTAAVVIEVAADDTTDGTKVLTVVLRNSPNVFGRVTINDTSREQTYRIWYSSDVAGNSRIDTINEGQVGYIQLRASEDHTVGLSYANSTIDANDFESPLPALVDIVGGAAYVRFAVRNDYKSENNESLVTSITESTDFTNVKATATLLVLDTSRTPTWVGAFYPNASSGTQITQINEGDSFVYKITAQNITTAQPISLTYSGTASQADFKNPWPTTGNLQTTTTFAYALNLDKTTEGDETFTITTKFNDPLIPTAPLVSSIRIIDTSVGHAVTDLYMSSTAAGTDKLTAAKVPVTVYTAIKTSGFANGEYVYVDYAGTDPKLITMMGFSTRVATVSNNYAYVTTTFTDTNGVITGATPLKATVYRAVNNLPVGDSLRTMSATINPRLAPSATLLLCGMNDLNPITAVNEGVKFRLRISTVNIPNGSPALKLTYGGTSTAADFNGVRPSSVTITNNVAFVEFSVKSDLLLEGSETCIIKVELPWNGGSVSATIRINDTSTPIVNLFFSSDAAGNTQITQVNEGTIAYIQARAAGYPDNTVLDMVYAGTVSDDDAAGGLPKTMDLIGGRATATLRFFSDNLLEGPEQLIATAKSNGVVVTTSAVSLTLNDTSVPGPVQVFWSESHDPYAPVGNLIFNETTKKIVWLHIETVNIPAGTVLDLSYTGTATADDFQYGLPTEVTTLAGNYTSMMNIIVADDKAEPGANETLGAIVSYNGRSIYSKSMIIEDTSVEITEIIVNGGETKMVYIYPGETWAFIVVGAGGGGGAGVHLTQSYGGGAGGKSSVVITSILDMVSGGGGGGGIGWWDNGSTWHSGGGGSTGKPLINKWPSGAGTYQTITGKTPISDRWNHPGAESVSLRDYYGAGGAGGNGSGTNDAANGGGGGSGSYMGFYYTNNTKLMQTATCVAGLGGEGGLGINADRSGKAGTSGVVIATRSGELPYDKIITESGYKVIRGYNLAEGFKRKFGHYPNSNDVVILEIPKDYAYVGSTASTPGITIDTNCNNAKSIIINNRGLISGIGGNGGVFNTASTNGSTGIKNTSTKIVIVNNYGIIGGGGGGAGASYIGIWGGGGGAPYGKGAPGSEVANYKTADGQDGSLLTGGASGYNQGYIQHRTGPGGNIGMPGPDGKQNTHNPVSMPGAKAGFVKEGSVTINNISGGVTKGR